MIHFLFRAPSGAAFSSHRARLHEFKCVEFVEELMYGHLRKAPK
jgi:hypothetical protein